MQNQNIKIAVRSLLTLFFSGFSFIIQGQSTDSSLSVERFWRL
jgi:hypothetical protein